MKLPSLQSLWLSLLAVIIRFPLQIICAGVATISWCIVVDTGANDLEERLVRLIFTCNLALALLLAADLYAEVNDVGAKKKWLLRLLSIAICSCLYTLLHPEFYLADVYRIGIIAFAFHLLVAFAPFVGRGSINGFWQYNKTLFLRFLTSALYASVLYAGLAIALVAVDELFDVSVSWRVYMRLFAIVSAGFMTVFFLAGIPKDFTALDREESYPRGLKIFAQYVLIPLMTIYLVILLVYEAKIILAWELPKGLVSILILGYAVFGILSLLLIFPVKDQEENKWIKLFSRFFYVMMIPLVVLLLLAVWKRVGNYGITESRYILIVLAIWLTLVTAYFLLSKKQNIMMIPMSLCVLSLLAIYGPQSAFSVSRYSQIQRLKKVMNSDKKKDLKERSEIVSYLVRRHGLSALQSFTKTDLKAIENKMELKAGGKYSRYRLEYDKVDSAYRILNIKGQKESLTKYLSFKTSTGNAIRIKGYDAMVTFDSYMQSMESSFDGQKIEMEKNASSKELYIRIGDGPKQAFNLRGVIKNILNAQSSGRLKESESYSGFLVPDSMMVSGKVSYKGYEAVVVLSDLNVNDIDGADAEVDNANYNGVLLIRLK